MTMPALIHMTYRVTFHSAEQLSSSYYFDMFLFLLAVFVSFTNQVCFPFVYEICIHCFVVAEAPTM